MSKTDLLREQLILKFIYPCGRCENEKNESIRPLEELSTVEMIEDEKNKSIEPIEKILCFPILKEFIFVVNVNPSYTEL